MEGGCHHVFDMNFLTTIFTSLKNFCFQSCDYIKSYDDTMRLLEGEVRQLRSKREDVIREVQAAQRRRLNPEVLEWLDSVEDLEREAELINDKFEGMIVCICSFPVNVCSGYQLRRRAAAALTMARHLKQRVFRSVVEDLDLVRFIEMPNPEMVGMDEVFEELQQHARDDGVGIIGIHGMGGVGKTTLLRRFNNDFPKKELDLDVVIFLELTKDYKVEDIQKSLFNRLNLTWHDGVTQRARVADIFRVLKKLKIVLLIDNLWEPFNFQLVGIPFLQPPSKCKIIFTTRMEIVCSRTGAEKMIKVECLAEEAAWNLFRFSARMELFDTHTTILAIAKGLAMKCGGLPASLITVARAMASNKTIQEWRHAFTTSENDALFQLLGKEEGVAGI